MLKHPRAWRTNGQSDMGAVPKQGEENMRIDPQKGDHVQIISSRKKGIVTAVHSKMCPSVWINDNGYMPIELFVIVDEITLKNRMPENSFFSLRQVTDEFIDFDGWLLRSNRQGAKEVHVSLTFNMLEHNAYMVLIEEKFVGSNEPIGPEYTISLTTEAALEILGSWKKETRKCRTSPRQASKTTRQRSMQS
jgi:hypothetical protein